MTQIILNAKDVTSPSVSDDEKTFIKETITKGYLGVQKGRFAGKGFTSLDALVEEFRAQV